MISCSDAVTQLWRYVDESLDASDQRLVAEHLGVCRQCCGELEFAQVLHGMLADSTSNEIPPEVRARLEAYARELEA